MAMYHPFDETLVGYKEVVTLKTSDLPIPLFVFPKGSFFVDNTYAVIKGTNTILRPGIDYAVLSCNETIPFSTNAVTNTKLKDAYVRNAILLKLNSPAELEWYVAYSGGEETTKASEYQNYVNQLYNEARAKGTVNLYTTPNQGWGGYLNVDNTQIVSGKHIYSKPFLASEEIEKGDGLGWGKVELAMQALAESVAMGHDPAIVDAFINWSNHNEIEFNKVKAQVDADLNNKIVNLDGKRVDVEQFVFADSPKFPATQKFIEHNNIILRGLDPSQSEKIGFHGLAGFGFDINSNAVKIHQRKADSHVDQRVRYGATFETETIATITSAAIRYRLLKSKAALTGKFTLYVVSKQLGKVIHTRDVSTQMADATVENTLFSFTYPTDNQKFSVDTLFIYVLDENNQGDFGWVGSARYVVKNVSYGYSLAAINRGNLLGSNETHNTSPSIEVIVRRDFSLYANTFPLRVNPPNSNTVIKINGASLINVAFAAGESEKRLMVTLDQSSVLDKHSSLVFKLGPAHTPLATLLIGLKSTGLQDYGQIRLLDNASREVSSVAANVGYILEVQFNKDSDYFLDDLQLQVTNHTNDKATAKLGERLIKDKTKVHYPIVFTGVTNSILSLELKNLLNASFKTNILTLALNSDQPITEGIIFPTIEVGSNLKVKREDTNYLLNFDLILKDNSLGGYVFDVSSSNANLQLPSYVVSAASKVRFQAKLAVAKATNGKYSITFTRDTKTYTISFNLSFDKLIPIEIEYKDGGLSNSSLELKRPFRWMVSNPYSDKRLTLTRTTFPIELGMSDIVYGNALSEIMLESLTLEPGQRAQLSVGDWVSIESIKQNNLLNSNNLLYSPNVNIATINASTGSVDKVASFLNEVGVAVINNQDFSLSVINRLTSKADLVNNSLNHVDVIIDLNTSVSLIKSVKVRDAKAICTLDNISFDTVDDVVIASLLIQPDKGVLDGGYAYNVWVDLLDANSVKLYEVNVSLGVVND